MTSVVFGTPASPPPAIFQPWTGFKHTWTGWDGSQWDLSDPDGGVVLLVGGLRGMSMPKFDRYTSTSPASAGSRRRGGRTRERSIDWPILVYADESSEEWVARDSAFWASMHPELPGLWTVTAPSGRSRSLLCTFVDDGDQAYDVDPAEAGWALYQPKLVAEQPYWLGSPVRSPKWQLPAPRRFIAATGAPPFHIGRGSTSASAKLRNDGDVAAWTAWAIDGGSAGVDPTALTARAGGGLLTFPPVPVGSRLVVDTDPRRQTAYMDGVDVAGLIGWDPRPIPAKEEIPVDLTLTGPGSVQAMFTPRHFRAI
ncbi:hypothetical protein [Oerskovia jenensis]|uniref:hypothetical protein n=1 Tax=Oerskovia jenensis TaxID=162169 RepID=UPI0036DD835E